MWYAYTAYGHENILLLKNATDHGYKLVIQFVVFLWDVDEVGELEAQRFKDLCFVGDFIPWLKWVTTMSGYKAYTIIKKLKATVDSLL